MEKKKLLFVISRMTLGGAQKSMISAINNLDFDKYDVSLYIRENKITDIINQIDRRAEIVINDNKSDYTHSSAVLLMSLVNKLSGGKCNQKITDYVVKKTTEYERKKFFSKGNEYDIAISYINGYTCKFVIDVINAKKKILFFLGSSDPIPSLHKKYLPEFDAVVSDSKGTAAFVSGAYPEIASRMRVIENYIDCDEIAEKSRAESFVKPDILTLCTCGRMSQVKGFDMAVEAGLALKENGIEFKWIFVGDGPEREKIEKLIEKYSLEDNFILVGSQTNPYPFIRSCDIYVQPSYEESYGLTITEAMMLHRVVVSTDTVGGREQITDGENGLLASVSPEGISASLLALLSNKNKYNHISEVVSKKDYSENLVVFKDKWKRLLEEI